MPKAAASTVPWQIGDALELIGRPPFHILLGNAPTVTLRSTASAWRCHHTTVTSALVLGQ
jgi:hypothetical protein